MSKVTDVIFTCALGDDLAYQELNRTLATGLGVCFTRVDGMAGGDKHMQAVVALGGFNRWENYSGVFDDMVKAMDWRFPDAVRVFVNTEQGEAGFQPREIEDLV